MSQPYRSVSRPRGRRGSSFARRWLLRPFLSGVVFGVSGAALVYLPLCVWQGFVMSTELAPWYGFLVIRIVVVILLSLLNLVILPLRLGPQVLVIATSAFAIAFPLGVVYALTLTPSGYERLKRSAGQFLYVLPGFFLIGLFVPFEIAVIADATSSSLLDYAFGPDKAIILVLLALGMLIVLNLSYSVIAYLAERRFLWVVLRTVPSPLTARLGLLKLRLTTAIFNTPGRLRLWFLSRTIRQLAFEYQAISQAIQVSASRPPPKSIPLDHARMLVEMASAVSFGTIQASLNNLRRRVATMQVALSVHAEELDALKEEVIAIRATMIEWRSMAKHYLEQRSR